MPFFINTFDVTIQLESLTCVKEFDSYGHSEPYLWTAFLFVDNTTLTGPNPLGVLVPLETQSGHGVFGAAGKNVKAGAVIPIPESIGLFKRRLFSHKSSGPHSSNEIMFAGFVAVLLEEDETSEGAIAAGHKELGPALQDEILRFYFANNRFPSSAEITAIKEKVAERVHGAIGARVGCWSGFWSDQDDLIGVVGDDDTLFTASEIRGLSRKGRAVRQTPIHGTETVMTFTGRYATLVVMEHYYILTWSIRVDPVTDFTFPTESIDAIERIGSSLEQLDLSIVELVARLESQKGDGIAVLEAEIEEKVKRIRPGLVREFEAAWAELAQNVSEANTKCN